MISRNGITAEKLNHSFHSARQWNFPIMTDINSLHFTVKCFSSMDIDGK